MNIIELAKEVGAEPNYILLKCEALERFAALVRAEYEAPLKLAEEALESAPIEYDFHGNPMDEDYGKLSNKALAAIREVRAEQEKHEPVGEVDLHKELGQMRWMGGDEGWDNAIHAVRNRLEELYAAPVSAKREWVDLTDDEIEDAVGWTMTEGEMLECRAVITAFKEKNK